MKNEALIELYYSQLKEFDLAAQNYAGLQRAVYRIIPFGSFDITLQYNPARITSTNAKIDPDSLQQRKCFLCRENLPAQQQGIPYDDRYHIYLNPYPIFPRHFVVSSDTHIPQRIDDRFEDLLELTSAFPEWTAFYNGPACGASAPDHFHFQLVPRHFLSIEKDTYQNTIRKMVIHTEQYSVSCLEPYLRKVLILESSTPSLLTRLFEHIRTLIGDIIPYETEPMLNIVVWTENHCWKACLFPRRALRPWQFYAEGDGKILFSPGCVDMGGVIVSPRRTDFDRYSAELLTDLFSQVTPEDNSWNRILESIKTISL